jgi:hypothetical protein
MGAHEVKKMKFKKPLSIILAACALAIMPVASLPAHASSYGEVQLSPSYRNSYIASTTFYTPPTGVGSTFFSIKGPSNGKSANILSIAISRVTTGSGNDNFSINKRSSADGAGTTVTAVPCNSGNPAASSVVQQYTSAPSVGSLIGSVGGGIVQQAAVGTNLVFYNTNSESQALTLNSASETVDIQGVTSLAGTVQVVINWTEQ